MAYDLYVGIDYSGASTPIARSRTLQVYAASAGEQPVAVRSLGSTNKRVRSWNRREIAEWLVSEIASGKRVLAGIDHAFSFPMAYFERYKLKSWHEFLDDFCRHWPLLADDSRVEDFRPHRKRHYEFTREGKDYRLTETWSPSAKSVFLFDVQGSVAKSTHAGLPWLGWIRQAVGEQVHIWPFEGWDPPSEKSVIAEVYPSVFSKRYERAERTADEQDAYAVARWLVENDQRGFLQRYFNPPLTSEQQRIASKEGWILGIT
ncbi:MAG: hypothetical protein RID07_05355 [Lacipirellulaceae bacterium]